MGADLYINSLYEKNNEKYKALFDNAVQDRDRQARGSIEYDQAQAEVDKYYELMYSEGYFRDSYNKTSLFWLLNLSWWQCNYINKNGLITPSKAKKLLKHMESLEIPDKENLLGYLGSEVTIDEDANSIDSWHKFFSDKRTRFIEFLKTAIELKEPIRASV